MDANLLTEIVTPIVTAAFAYLIARRGNVSAEHINKAKIESDIQVQALTLVKGVMVDMKEEFHAEIKLLRDENSDLKRASMAFEIHINECKTQISANNQTISDLRQEVRDCKSQLLASDAIIATLKQEISILQSTIKLYETERNFANRNTGE